MGWLACLRRRGYQERLLVPHSTNLRFGREPFDALFMSAYLFINLGITHLLGEQKGYIRSFYEHECCH